MSVAVVVLAAGLGVRLGAATPKALVQVAHEPLLVHCLRGLDAVAVVDELVVVAPRSHVEDVRMILSGGSWRCPWQLVVGGTTRHRSVAAGLAALSDGADVVLVHDAARAFVPVEMVERVVEAVRSGAEACVPVLPVTDTVKQVDGDRVVATVDRDSLAVAQTPQGFSRAVLVGAHESADDSTDDVSVVERAGGQVRTVAGHAEAFKITTSLDLAVAEALLRRRAQPAG